MAQSTASEVGQKLSGPLKIYLAVLGLLGVGVMVAGFLLEWGYWGWFGGGLLILAGWGSLIANRFKIGWQPAVGPCPSCGTKLHFLTKKQYVRCARCQAFLRVEGQTLSTVGGNIISDAPEYPAPYVQGVTFPGVCMLCGQTATQADTVRWDHHQRKANLLIATVIEVTKLQAHVPVCAAHAGQKAVAFAYGDHSSTQHGGLSLKFRSLGGLEAYVQHNAALLPPTPNEPQMIHAPSAE